MAAVRLLHGTYREVWREASAVNFDGGTTTIVTTGIRVARNEERSKCRARLKLSSKVGIPIVSDPVFTVDATGDLLVTFTNSAGAGNRAAWTLEVWQLTSAQQEVDAAYAGLGWVDDANGSSSAPGSGTVRLYVDGTNGNDANVGDSFAAGHPWRTSARVEQAVAALLYIEPTSLVIEVFVRNTLADLHLQVLLAGNSLVYVGQHVDDMTVYRTGTVSGVGGAAPTHGMERLTLLGAGLDGTEVGMTLLLTDPVTGTNRGTATIVRVDVGNQYVWITQPIGGLPPWVAASPAVATVRLPSAYVDGEIEMTTSGFLRANDITATTINPISGFICLRSRTVTLNGTNPVGVFGCYVRRTNGTWGTVRCRATYASSQYYRFISGGQAYYIPEAVAIDYGLIGGPTPITNNILGIGCGNWSTLTGESLFCGYCDDTVSVQRSSAHGSSFYASAKRYDAIATCNHTGNYLIIRGSSRALFAEANGVLTFRYLSGLDLPAAGVPYFIEAQTGGVIRILGTEFEVNNTGTNPCDLARATSGGLIRFDNGIPDTAKAKTRQLVADEGRIETGNVALTSAREGGGPDFYVRGGSIEFMGNVVKGAVNTAASAILEVCRGGRVTQVSGGTFVLPAGSGNHTTDYGANGAIYLHENTEVMLGTLSGAGAGTVNTGCKLANNSRLCHGGAGGAGFLGAAPLVIGGAAAAVWPVNPASDLAAGVPQFCFVVPNV